MKSPENITVSQAIVGYLLNIEGRRLSPNTIRDYRNTLSKFSARYGAKPINSITTTHVSEFLASYPELTKKTISNYHIALSSMWTWLKNQDIVEENIIHQVDRPKPEKRIIAPLEESEIKALFAAIQKTSTYARPGKCSSSHTLPNIDRNRAMMLFFLDNGVRVSELINLRIEDLDIKNLRARVMGKGAKERYVPYSARTGQAIWRYLTTRDNPQPEDHLFVNQGNRPLTRNLVEHYLVNLGNRAGVSKVHPHRLRHTFAVSYLRAGGDIFTLQMIDRKSVV